jgi:hypothetical protein
MDKTGLFFKMLPNHSYIKAKDAKSATESKLMKAKDSMKLYVTTDGTGSDSLPLSMIGKSKSPQCFKNWHATHIVCSK